jgi:hypothetical protein
MRLVEVSIFRGSITSVWPASYGLFAQMLILAPLFLPSWVPSFYEVWQGFINNYIICHS